MLVAKGTGFGATRGFRPHSWSNSVFAKVASFLKPQNVTYFGNRAIDDV